MAETLGRNKAHFYWAQIKQILESSIENWVEIPENVDNKLEITGINTDSRAVEDGNLFVALSGEKFDGHNFLQQVKDQGAIGAIVERAVDITLPQITVENSVEALGKLARAHQRIVGVRHKVAITGSYGKTTTRALIYSVVNQQFHTLTSRGNFNNEIGLPMTLFQLETEHEVAVVEMGMRGRGQIEYLAKIAEPTVAVITNIGPQHIELLGSVEEIALAKAEILESLPANGLAVLPADSPFLELLKSKAKCRVVTFGNDPKADYLISNIETQPDGTIDFDITIRQSQIVSVHLPMIGAHNALNAAAAFAVAFELGINTEKIKRGLETAEVPGARMRVLKTSSGTTIIDDCYNAGPDSMRAALNTLLDFPGSARRIAVLGAMRELGNFSEVEHRKIGNLAGQFVEVLIGVGGETRPLLNAAIESAKTVENDMRTLWFESAVDAAAEVGNWLRNGDLVLVKGSRSIGLEKVVEVLH